jgi:hypothetical protein
MTAMLLFSIGGLAQTKTIAKGGKQIAIDALDNVYVLSTQNELLKYDAKGTLLQRYSQTRAGEITSFDVRNPLRILVYYADFQQIVVLDNMLSQVASYSFADNLQRHFVAVASAGDNHFWAFDSLVPQLVMCNWQGKELFSSVNLSSLADTLLVPKRLYTSDENIFLLTADNKVLMFDRFGAWRNTWKLDKKNTLFAFAGNTIYGVVSKFIFSYRQAEAPKIIMQISKDFVPTQFAVGDKILALLNEKAVLLQSIN